MNWLRQNTEWVWDLLLTHLALSIPPVLLSLLLSVPLGWYAARHPRLRGILVTGTSLLYAIPSLPLFIIIPILTDIPLRSSATIVIALTLYGMALLVRGAADAFAAVPADVEHAGQAMGYSPWSLFWKVELPLAGPVLLSALRVVVVSTVSLVTVGAVIGIASLGSLFTDGFQRGIYASVFTGLILTIVVAAILDQLCVAVGRLTMPWQSRTREVSAA